MITFAQFKAMIVAGATGEVILEAIRPLFEMIAGRRERKRQSMRRWRAGRHHVASRGVYKKSQQNQPSCGVYVGSLNNPSLPSEELPRGNSSSGHARKPRTPLADDFNPVHKLEEAEELDRFKDWARANGKLYADWPAAWRNWLRSPYRKPNGGHHGNGRRPLPEGNVSVEQIFELADELRRQEQPGGSLFGQTPDLGSGRSGR